MLGAPWQDGVSLGMEFSFGGGVPARAHRHGCLQNLFVVCRQGRLAVFFLFVALKQATKKKLWKYKVLVKSRASQRNPSVCAKRGSLCIRVSFSLLAVHKPQPVHPVRKDCRCRWEQVPTTGLLVAHFPKLRLLKLFRSASHCPGRVGREPLNFALGVQLNSHKDRVSISGWK